MQYPSCSEECTVDVIWYHQSMHIKTHVAGDLMLLRKYAACLHSAVYSQVMLPHRNVLKIFLKVHILCILIFFCMASATACLPWGKSVNTCCIVAYLCL